MSDNDEVKIDQETADLFPISVEDFMKAAKLAKRMFKNEQRLSLGMDAKAALVMFLLLYQILSFESMKGSKAAYTLVYSFSLQMYQWFIDCEPTLKHILPRPVPHIELDNGVVVRVSQVKENK